MPASSDTLQNVGEASAMALSLQSPTGPDAAARWTLSGTYGGATLVFEKASTKAAYDAGLWAPLASVVRQDTNNVLANGELAGLTNRTLDVVAPSLLGLYAVRCRLAALGSGGVVVQGVTTAGSLSDPSALMATVALELIRVRLGLSALTGTDLSGLTTAGG